MFLIFQAFTRIRDLRYLELIDHIEVMPRKNPLITFKAEFIVLFAGFYFSEITIVRLGPEEIVMVMADFIATFLNGAILQMLRT